MYLANHDIGTRCTLVALAHATFPMEGASLSKRRRVVVPQDGAAICKLPEDLVLHMFSFLDVLSLVRCSWTCRQWNRLSGDWTLWRHVDLTLYKLDTKRLWKFVRQRCSDKVEVQKCTKNRLLNVDIN